MGHITYCGQIHGVCRNCRTEPLSLRIHNKASHVAWKQTLIRGIDYNNYNGIQNVTLHKMGFDAVLK